MDVKPIQALKIMRLGRRHATGGLNQKMTGLVDKIIRNFKGTILLCSFLVLSAIIYFENQANDQATPREIQRLSSSKTLLYFKGFSMIDTGNGGDRVAKIEADELTVIPKKYYLFNFKPFNEIVLKNPMITTYMGTNERKIEESGYAREEHRFSFPRIEPPTNTFNRYSTTMISGVQLNGFRWLIMKGEKEFFKCRAQNGYFNINKSELQLNDLELENVELGKRIAAKRGVIDLKSSLVKIPTSSIRQSNGILIGGHAIQLDMNLNQIPH